MKEVSIYILTFFLLFASCKKDEYISNKGIPEWLRYEIEKTEESLENADGIDMINYGAWLRYKYKEFYFEYHNPFMSACCYMYDFLR